MWARAQPGVEYWVLALCASILLDLAYPRHTGVLYLIHPVRLSFLTATKLAKPYSGLGRGVTVLFVVTAWALSPAALALYLTSPYPLAWLVVSVVVLKFSIALRLLVDTVMSVALALEKGGLDEARRRVGEVVRRPVDGLSGSLVASAAIESLAENVVDGYTAPLTYYPVLGPLGPLLQRVVNTLDGAVGYKTPEYERVGKPSAYADTLLNYVPARLTAALIILVSPLAGGSPLGSFRSWLRWRRATGSLNSGHPMSAIAGALGVRLEKPSHYVINPAGRSPGPRDVAAAVRIMSLVAVVYTLLITLVTTLFLPLHSSWFTP